MTTPPSSPQPVSIIGIGCRVPGAAGVDQFWRLLAQGRDATGTPPAGGSSGQRDGHLDGFDNGWFAISDRESAVLGPRLRLSLEVAVEAIDDAGIGYRVGGSQTAVVFGASGDDHGTPVLGRDAPSAAPGSASSAIANRLSYVLDLRGPSLVLDSTCSSSLAAVDLAVRLLDDDTVPLAIVAGVNLTLPRHTSSYRNQGGSPDGDGRGTPCDAEVDGYPRSDGCTVLVLQRSIDAHREGNRIYAEIVGTALGSDGRSDGVPTPNARAQQQVIRTAWTRAGSDPRTAGYFECHGAGTASGDAVEVGALAAILGPASESADKAWIGSVKSSVGHLGAAAGVTGLAKAALCIRHGTIAPTSNFRRENPLLKLEERGLRVPTEPIGWHEIPPAIRYAGVSSFGFGGTTAHVVLRGVDGATQVRDIDPPLLIPVSGRDDTDVRAVAARWAAQAGDTSHALREFASAAARLLPEQVRAVVVAWDRDDAIEQLRALAEPDTAPLGNSAGIRRLGGSQSATSSRTEPADVPTSNARGAQISHEQPIVVSAHPRRGAVLGPFGSRRRGGLLFLFSGQGGQHRRMGRQLAARYPAFVQALSRANDAVVRAGGPQVWTPRYGFGNSLGTTDFVEPALFAHQIALAELLATWGIRPDAVLGHSAGEIAAAVVSGALSLQTGARIVVARSIFLARFDGHAAMAMLEATPEQAWRLVEPMRTEVGIAAINGPRAIVVSGVPRSIATLIRRAKRRRLSAQRIAIDCAAHSPQVREMLPDLAVQLSDLDPQIPRLPIYSTTRRGEVVSTAVMDSDYWADNVAGTVDLAAALDLAAGDGLSTVVEIAPHPVLTPAVREHPDFRDTTYPVSERDGEAAAFTTGVGRLYLEGRFVDWSAQGAFTAPNPERVWQRRSFPLVAEAGPDASTDDLDDHVVQGVPTVPAVYWLRQLLRTSDRRTTRLADFTVHDRTDLTALAGVTYRAGADLLEVVGRVIVASARRSQDPAPAEIVGWMRIADAHHSTLHGMRALDPGAFYDGMRRRRLDYGPRFRPLRGGAIGNHSAIGLFGHIPLDTAALDGCLQLIAAAAGDLVPDQALPLPVAIASAWLCDTPELLLTEAHAFVRTAGPTGLGCDVIATDQHGAPAIALLGVQIRYAELPEHGVLPKNSPATSIPRAVDGEQTLHRDVRGGATHPIAGRIRSTAKDVWGTPGSNYMAAAHGRILEPTGHRDDPCVLRHETWVPIDIADIAGVPDNSRVQRVLVVGESRLAVTLTRAADRRLPTERIARDPAASSPIVSAVLTGRSDRTAVILVWPAAQEPGPIVTVVGRALDLLQRMHSCAAMTTLTVILRDRASVSQQAIAGLVRSLQLESKRSIRLIWMDTDRCEPGPACEVALNPAGPEEVRIASDIVEARRFEPAPAAGPPFEISSEGTYVVTGGLGALGAVGARWLLDSGARDVVVLTRTPRPLPPLLDGLEDRIVVVRCDVADRSDLANALDDIRECGSTIRGLLHSAGSPRDAEFSTVTTGLLAAMFEPKVLAAIDLLELTTADPIDFTLLFSSASGVLGAPGQAAYAAANAALDALARLHTDRRAISIGWGGWETGSTAGGSGGPHLRRAGIIPFDVPRATAVLSNLRGASGSYVLALDYTPTSDTSPLSVRLRNTLAEEAARPVTQTIRTALATTLGVATETLDVTADFTDLGLTSQLATELRRTLEIRLDIRIATTELFEHRTIAALSAELTPRVRTVRHR